MGKIWRIHIAAYFKEFKKNLFIVTFSTEVEKQCVLAGRPWLFNNNLIALKSLDGQRQLTKIVLTTKHFWIQLHGLPIRYMNKTMAN